VVVDGGGHVSMDAILADVRLMAQRRGAETIWRLAAGGNAATAEPHGALSEADACKAALAILQAIAALGKEARAKDLSASTLSSSFRGESLGEASRVSDPIGIITLSKRTLALGIALPFGSMPASVLINLAQAALAADATEIRPAPGRSLLFLGLSEDACHQLQDTAAALGFITNTTDPRLHIAACPGTPACASGKIETRTIAEYIAATQAGFLDGSFTLHISGCTKGCAHPSAAALTMAGREGGTGLVINGSAKALSPDSASCNDAARGLAAIAKLVQISRQPNEDTAACLARLGAATIQTAYRQD